MPYIKGEVYDININGDKYYYQVTHFKSKSDYHDDSYHTDFFKKYKDETKKSWFGLVKKTELVPDVIFTIHHDIRNANYSKVLIRNLIKEKIEKLERQREIDNNIII